MYKIESASKVKYLKINNVKLIRIEWKDDIVWTNLFGKILEDKTATKNFEEAYQNSINRNVSKQDDSNITGFKLKAQFSNKHMGDFYQQLITNGFILTLIDIKLFNSFFRGEIPERKINWRKDLHELKYFIDCICNDEILEKKPGQQWKYIDKIFTHDRKKLPENWQRNHNKLKDNKKKDIINLITDMLLVI